MQIYVVRHTVAEDRTEGQSDAERALTKDGKKRLEQVVYGLRGLDVKFDRVLTSPWKRARDTAKRLEPLYDGELVETELLCQSPRSELLALIADRGLPTCVVGHQPWLGELVSWLAFGDMRFHEQLDLKKAGFVELEGSCIPGGMKLKSFVPPTMMRAVR